MADIVSTIRGRIIRDVFDYQLLMDVLSGYSKPRDAVTGLLSEGVIIRIKKGLYCFGEAHRRGPLCVESIANLLYGPSYVSLEYALSYHGLIPERVFTVTSVTSGRSRVFETPLGRFSYRMLNTGRFAVGQRIETCADSPFFIACAEKALVDKVWTDRRFDGKRVSDFGQYLTEDLRIEPGTLGGLDPARMMEICEAYGSAKIRNLVSHLRRGW